MPRVHYVWWKHLLASSLITSRLYIYHASKMEFDCIGKDHTWDLTVYSGLKHGCDIKTCQNHRCGLPPKAPSSTCPRARRGCLNRKCAQAKQAATRAASAWGAPWDVSERWQRMGASVTHSGVWLVCCLPLGGLEKWTSFWTESGRSEL